MILFSPILEKRKNLLPGLCFVLNPAPPFSSFFFFLNFQRVGLKIQKNKLLEKKVKKEETKKKNH